MPHPRISAERRQRLREQLELLARHLGIGVGRREVRPGAVEPQACRLLDVPGQRRRVFGRAAVTAHASVDLQVHRHHFIGLVHRLRHGKARQPDGAAGRGRGPRLRRHEAAHDEDVLGGHEPDQLPRLGECGNGEPGGASVERGTRSLDGAVPVGVGLHHREEVSAFGQVLEDAGRVGADGL